MLIKSQSKSQTISKQTVILFIIKTFLMKIYETEIEKKTD